MSELHSVELRQESSVELHIGTVAGDLGKVEQGSCSVQSVMSTSPNNSPSSSPMMSPRRIVGSVTSSWVLCGFDWDLFLRSAGIPPSFIDHYVKLFEDANVDETLLDDLSEYWLDTLGIKSLGHKIKICKHAKKCSAVSSAVIGSYAVKQPLGEGTNHTVSLGVSRTTGKTVALKILRKKLYVPGSDPIERWWQNPTAHERNLLQRLHSNPHVIKMIDACFDVKYTQVDGSQHTTHMLVLECALCSVYDLVSRSGPFREPHARYWFQQLVQGLEGCHAKGVIHRDLKAEQILLTDRMELRISDFNFGECVGPNSPSETSPSSSSSSMSSSSSSPSLSSTIPPEESKDSTHPKTKPPRAVLVGTVRFMAPEVETVNSLICSFIFAFGFVAAARVLLFSSFHHF